ncbi:MAG: PIN domain nuclease [Bacteroidetes bacterium]|nr:MAG: PIN domain nuclease [Bacteroidota bacterium]
MIIVDSSVWIPFFNGQDTRETQLLDKLLGQQPVAIGDLILAEVLQGFRHNKDYQQARTHLLALPCLDMGGKAVALQSADTYRQLRRQGITIRKTIDLLIGTYCIIHDHQLLHQDHDFAPLVTHFGLQEV